MQLFLFSSPLPHTTFKSVYYIASASSVSAATLIQILIIVIWTPLVIYIDFPASSLYLLPVDHSSASRGCAQIVKLIFFFPCLHSSRVPPLPASWPWNYFVWHLNFVSYCCSVAESCPTLCDPMDFVTPVPSILHYLPEFAQIHVHWVGDAIQPSRPLPPPSALPSVFSSIKVFSSGSALHLR